MGQGTQDPPKPDEPYSHPDAATDQALDWFLRLQDESGDRAVRAEFERWLAGDPQRRDAFSRLQRMQSMPSLRKAAERDAGRLGMSTNMRARRGSVAWLWPRGWPARIAAAAAVVLLLVSVPQIPGLMLRWQADYITAAGEVQRVRLPDGSDMTLNTASAVAVDFKEGRRRITLLAGEAYFDVYHDPAHPFVVAGPFSEVEAKGTAFDVRADAGHDVVVLERGHVGVRRNQNMSDQTDLKPDQMVTVSANALSAVTIANLETSLAWRDGRIVFRDQPFDIALTELRRYYSGPVIVANRQVSETLVNGNYRVADPQAAIRTLAESAGAAVTYLPGGVIVLH